mmetsp:Transcript_158403/g.508118  ORF Transcript_158403/g.508118 Transcript_158403/m.508118 type:complete len:230 (-) Transcript_158403:438-1127(-)
MMASMKPLEPARVQIPKARPLPSHSELLTKLELPMRVAPLLEASTRSAVPLTPPGIFSPPGLPTPPGLLLPFRPPPGLELPGPVSPAALSWALMLAVHGDRSAKAVDTWGASFSSGSETASTTDPADDLPSPFPERSEAVPEPPVLPVLNLCDALAAGKAAFACSAACPSVGSAEHHLGVCRPCDFASRGVECRAGATCQFCHLCGPGESWRPSGAHHLRCRTHQLRAG